LDDPLNALNIATATTTLVKSGRGNFGLVTINTTAAGTITIYDSLTASGTKIGTIQASATPATYFYNCRFLIGLTVVTGAASDITVTFE
jgi:hypothetical protein